MPAAKPASADRKRKCGTLAADTHPTKHPFKQKNRHTSVALHSSRRAPNPFSSAPLERKGQTDKQQEKRDPASEDLATPAVFPLPMSRTSENETYEKTRHQP